MSVIEIVPQQKQNLTSYQGEKKFYFLLGKKMLLVCLTGFITPNGIQASSSVLGMQFSYLSNIINLAFFYKFIY